MLRFLYRLLWWIALPLLPLRLWWRGRREPGYRVRVGERFGRYGTDTPQVRDVVWIHAVSLGETRAATPLVARILAERPRATILLTHMTATGRAAGEALAGPRVMQAWLPYDVPFAVDAFLSRFAPRVGILMETEVWPTLVATCARRRIPLFLVNARLSARSLAGYRRAASITEPMFAALSATYAQTDADAARLHAAGARAVKVTGNLKFDLAPPADTAARAAELSERIGPRPVWVAGCTRDGEEAMILDALAAATLPPRTLTLIVPRHPQRFADVARLLDERGVAYVKRSAGGAVPPEATVLLGDSLGELAAYYAAADVAFVAGNLAPLGGHNLLEAIAAGTPTLVGPHTFNFAEATQEAVAAGAALRVGDASALLREVAALLEDPGRRERMRTAGAAFLAAHRGATDRLWNELSRSIGG